MSLKKVYKYGTGDEIPEDAVYLSTQVEKEVFIQTNPNGDMLHQETNKFVWHYFLIDPSNL